jgi:hypothetical protein
MNASCQVLQFPSAQTVPSSSPADLRRHKRVPIYLDVRWDGLSGNNAARITDISLGGCYIETIGQVAQGEVIRFDILLKNGKWLPVQGTVMYQFPLMGFGVRFTPLSVEAHQEIADLVESAG